MVSLARTRCIAFEACWITRNPARNGSKGGATVVPPAEETRPTRDNSKHYNTTRRESPERGKERRTASKCYPQVLPRRRAILNRLRKASMRRLVPL